MQRWGRIDILHNNVGVSLSGGDAELIDITEEAFDRCTAINLKSCIFAAKHVLPIMREAAEWRDHQYLFDGGDHDLSYRRLQGDQGGDGRPSPSSLPTRTPSTASAPTLSCPA